MFFMDHVKGKVFSLHAWTVPEVSGGSGSKISRHLAREDG